LNIWVDVVAFAWLSRCRLWLFECDLGTGEQAGIDRQDRCFADRLGIVECLGIVDGLNFVNRLRLV